MKKIKTLKGWGIYQNSQKEIDEYGFSITVIHPENMEYAYMNTPRDSDIDLDTVEQAVIWIENY